MFPFFHSSFQAPSDSPERSDHTFSLLKFGALCGKKGAIWSHSAPEIPDSLLTFLSFATLLYFYALALRGAIFPHYAKNSQVENPFFRVFLLSAARPLVHTERRPGEWQTCWCRSLLPFPLHGKMCLFPSWRQKSSSLSLSSSSGDCTSRHREREKKKKKKNSPVIEAWRRCCNRREKVKCTRMS